MLTEEVLNHSPSYTIPKETIDTGVSMLLKTIESKPGFCPYQKFDPRKHLLYKNEDFEKVRIHTLKDLGIYKTHVRPISDVGVSDPFPLFTPEACDIMKWESFQKLNVERYGRLPIMSKGACSTDFQICGYTENAPFTLAAWKHPETQAIINKFAGIELEIMFDYEIAHINASLVEQRKIDEDVEREEKNSNIGESERAVFNWHYDSNSFTVVLMLSASDDMEGGKTGLKNGSDDIVYVDGPKVGYATILQGRVIKHIATKPISNDERISSIVGYVPKSYNVPDTTVMTTFRPSVNPRSLYNEYYPQWMEYRFKRIEGRLAVKREQLISSMKQGKRFNQIEVANFCKDISNYFTKSWDEFESVVENEIFPPKIFSIPYNDL